MKIDLSILTSEEFEYFANTTLFHDDVLRRKLKWLSHEEKLIEENYYDKETEKRQLNYCEQLLKEITNCNNLFKKIRISKGINPFEITKEEYNELLKFLVEQIYHAQNRKKDFGGDRFHWGDKNCSILIKQELGYIHSLEKVFNKYKGKHTYQSILDTL